MRSVTPGSQASVSWHARQNSQTHMPSRTGCTPGDPCVVPKQVITSGIVCNTSRKVHLCGAVKESTGPELHWKLFENSFLCPYFWVKALL